MAKQKKSEVSVNEEIRDLAAAIRKVTTAIFESKGGGAARIKQKSKSTQVTFKVSQKKRKDLEKAASRRLIQDTVSERRGELEAEIKRAVESVLIGLIGISSPSVKVMGRTLGSALPIENFTNGELASYVKSKKGAGEIGLEDPDSALSILAGSLLGAMSIVVTIGAFGIPKVNVTFSQTQLIKANPHPDTNSDFYSWLSLVTGPSFMRSIPGYTFVTSREMFRKASKVKQRKGASSNMLSTIKKIAKSPRSFGYAGYDAGLMFRNTREGNKRAAAQFAGATQNKGDYQPSTKFEGFWDDWWAEVKKELGRWIRLILFSAVRGAARSTR